MNIYYSTITANKINKNCEYAVAIDAFPAKKKIGVNFTTTTFKFANFGHYFPKF